MRRGVGIAAIQKKKEHEAKFKEKGSELASEQLEKLSTNLEHFRARLEDYAAKHRDEIRKNPAFRKQFQDMCASIGVDPLASGKGFWAEKLGVGDFYYELGVQIVEVCLATAHLNGGLITLDELRLRLLKSRSKTRKEDISSDDLLRAIEKLKVLGSGFQAIPVGRDGRYLIQSVPGELNMDHTRVLELAQVTGWVSVPKICGTFDWNCDRAVRAVEHMVKEGLAWVDFQSPDREPQYWFPGLYLNLQDEGS